MDSRLDQLRAQRALVQQHLAWLDREIAAAGGGPAAAPAAGKETAAPAVTLTAAGAGPEKAEMARLHAGDGLAQSPGDFRQGCWKWFAIAFVGFVLAVLAVYLFWWLARPPAPPAGP